MGFVRFNNNGLGNKINPYVCTLIALPFSQSGFC